MQVAAPVKDGVQKNSYKWAAQWSYEPGLSLHPFSRPHSDTIHRMGLSNCSYKTSMSCASSDLTHLTPFGYHPSDLHVGYRQPRADQCEQVRKFGGPGFWTHSFGHDGTPSGLSTNEWVFPAVAPAVLQEVETTTAVKQTQSTGTIFTLGISFPFMEEKNKYKALCTWWGTAVCLDSQMKSSLRNDALAHPLILTCQKP